MNATLIICMTIVIGLIVIGLFGSIIMVSMLKYKHQEIREYRIWLQIILDQFYSQMNRWVDKMTDSTD